MAYDGTPQPIKIKKSRFYIIGGIIVLAIAYFSFFDDYFKYLQVKSERTEVVCNQYAYKFPDGYFIEEVAMIKFQTTRDIEHVKDFMNTYPDSKEYKEVEDFKNQLWASEIKRYDSIVNVNTGFDKEAVSFFRNLLLYMRDQNNTEIQLDLQGDVEVKDFEEYPEEVITLLDMQFKASENRTVTDNIAAIKKHYRRGNIRSYERIITNSIEESFENVLSENFIKIVKEGSSDTGVAIKITYHIKNQEYGNLDAQEDEGTGVPNIWVYGKDGATNGFISYIIGVSIAYDFKMAIPDTQFTYAFSHKTNALDDINNVANIEDGYQRMTEQNFYNYANDISVKFGLTNITFCDCVLARKVFTKKMETNGADIKALQREYIGLQNTCEKFSRNKSEAELEVLNKEAEACGDQEKENDKAV
ncbi:hypothetical protein GCM10022393_30910 [Aquimarina addita]|uniref:Uncharacterized protein n=2 Tax=Aquimarina addita TaxID=870485 RepID=A0ABP6UNJ3_9FLAO